MKHTLTKTVLTVCLWASVGVAIVSAQQTPAQGDAPAEGDVAWSRATRARGGSRAGRMRGGELGST